MTTTTAEAGWYPVPGTNDIGYWNGQAWTERRPAHHADPAVELAALKSALAQHELAIQAKYTGWKPLTIWYTFWGAMLALGSLGALASGQAGTFLLGAVFSGLTFLYVRYLYRGGRYRVWFVIF